MTTIVTMSVAMLMATPRMATPMEMMPVMTMVVPMVLMMAITKDQPGPHDHLYFYDCHLTLAVQ